MRESLVSLVYLELKNCHRCSVKFLQRGKNICKVWSVSQLMLRHSSEAHQNRRQIASSVSLSNSVIEFARVRCSSVIMKVWATWWCKYRETSCIIRFQPRERAEPILRHMEDNRNDVCARGSLCMFVRVCEFCGLYSQVETQTRKRRLNLWTYYFRISREASLVVRRSIIGRLCHANFSVIFAR